MKNSKHIYKRDRFDDYNLRLVVEIIDTKNKKHRIDVYTTETDANAAWGGLFDIVTDKVKDFKIVHSATKIEDDFAADVINEWLKK